MGRGGYNGGGPSVKEPKANNVYLFSREQTIAPELLTRSHIVKAGESLANEKGGVQHEFGYVLEIAGSSTKPVKPRSRWIELLCALKLFKAKQPERHLKWIAASNLLNTPPMGPELARKFHIEYPEAPRPWGFEQLQQNSQASEEDTQNHELDSTSS
jgi:hypothetical protein